MPFVTCSIEECGRPAVARGWCNRHWTRWRTYADPTSGSTGHGDAEAFARRLVRESQTDNCVTWPYGRTGEGYGTTMRINGVAVTPHRFICELVNGKPEKGQLALHSCGRGKQGCVNPAHLSWGNFRDNYWDSVRHGTAPFGSSFPHSKITDEQASEIIRLRRTETLAETAMRYGVSRSYVSQLQTGSAKRASRLMKEDRNAFCD